MNILSFGVLVFTAWCAATLCAHCTKGTWRSPWMWAAMLAAALLLLRPHGDTFTALDHSGYRLMAYAFAEGRGANDVDRTLLEIPDEARKYCTLLPRTKERNTRDRSFRLLSEQTGATEPFFMPTLPIGAAALHRIVPQIGLDLFVPLVGLALAWAFLAAGFRAGGISGLLLAVALFLGSPLPAMLLRGFYAEVCGGALVALAALHWITLPRDKPASLVAWAALGLAPAFHPVLVVASLPLLSPLIADHRETRVRILAGLVLFAIGPALLVWITANICAPYGNIDFGSLLYNFRHSPSHQVAYLFMLAFGLVAAAVLLWRLLAPESFSRALACLRPASRLWLLASLLPLLPALFLWSQASNVERGLADLWSGVGWPLAVVLGACALIMLVSSAAARARFVAGVALAVLPVFAYLKGEEQVAMWSQRRLAPFLFLLVVAVLVPAARALLTRAGQWRWVRLLAVAAALVLGLANLVRWPAPYWVRQECGALARVEELKERIGTRFVFFDYLPDSFPFAVDGKMRVAGWSERGRAPKLDILFPWLGQLAQTEEVWCVSSYSSPGMEKGVRLAPLFTETIEMERVHSKRALPAFRQPVRRELDFLRVEPTGPEPLSQRKVFDGGPLALRGNWGPVRPMAWPDGRRIQGQWSREGCGLVGPVPKAGRIRMAITASSGQAKTQRLKVVPPWGEAQAAWLEIPTEVSEHTVWFDVPAGGGAERTGVYRFHAAEPYDPARDGQGGYPPDLGVLIHRAEMDEVE